MFWLRNLKPFIISYSVLSLPDSYFIYFIMQYTFADKLFVFYHVKETDVIVFHYSIYFTRS